MRHQVLILFSAVASVTAQGVTDRITPPAPAPEGCRPHVEGKFEIGIMANKGRRDLALQNRAVCAGNGILVAELSNGIITDALNRTGYISASYQFQFDAPPQAGALYTAGFSHCGNGSLALGGSTIFYQCRSGGFYNLYDRWWAEQCSPVQILVMPCGGSDNSGAADVNDDQGQQVVATSTVATTVVVPLSDGHAQVVTTTKIIRICQIDDGQIQGHTTPCTAPATRRPTPAVSIPPVSQYSDGQIQVTPARSASVPATTGSQGEVTLPTSATPEATGAPLADAAVRCGGAISALLLAGLTVGALWVF
ncbi:Cell wall mannoprotein CIS3 [Madurella mycetomatis]|uniref:Cell wall mannoprotein CIS3 n=1 Tax=Madurella mycetomatis TaxID=100816 RepID=A0A175WHJ2_9PEZI|nr:Cell wall mannoprotein CIS3 [Madurella mycetomatis]